VKRDGVGAGGRQTGHLVLVRNVELDFLEFSLKSFSQFERLFVCVSKYFAGVWLKKR
jgi:hypothetical protein